MLLAMAAISSRPAAVIFPAVRNSGRSIVITTRLPCVRMTTPSNPSRSMHWLSSLAGQAIETLSRQPGSIGPSARKANPLLPMSLTWPVPRFKLP